MLQTERKYISVPARAETDIAVSEENSMYRTAGPDGGDGGRGGDLIFAIDEGLNTLVDYRHKRKYAAGDGEPAENGDARKRRERSYPLCSGGNSDQRSCDRESYCRYVRR